MNANDIRAKILALISEYYSANWPKEEFIPNITPIPCAGRVFNADEMTCLVDSCMDFWLTTGRFADLFESEFSRFFGLRHATLCNSGSSANLLALSALTSNKLGEKRLKPGDEVITAAAGFPTTVNPIIQNGLIPVFLDIEIGTYNIDVHHIENAIGPRTRAIMLAHTLGNPFNVDAVLKVAKRHDLWIVEDNCDSVGSTYKSRPTGTFGDMATTSFYPAHHITMGEGGCVLTNNSLLKTLVESFRDWGRDCWCKPGKDNTCCKRFEWQIGKMPYGYDHKYIYSHIGYNLKLTDMQAAIGVAQLKKLPYFIELRKRNWQLLYNGLKQFDEFLILPRATQCSDPSWFGFAITVRHDAPFKRDDLIRCLEHHKIATRLLFGGNLTLQPAYRDIPYRVVGDLKGTNVVVNQTFWIGVYPGLTEEMINYVIDTFRTYLKKF